MTGGLLFLLLIVIIAAFVGVVIYSLKNAKKLEKVSWFEKQWKKESTKTTASSLISIVVDAVPLITISSTALPFSSIISDEWFLARRFTVSSTSSLSQEAIISFSICAFSKIGKAILKHLDLIVGKTFSMFVVERR